MLRLPSGFSLSAPGGGEGWGEVGDSRAVAGTHLTLPRLRRGPLPLPPEGRRGETSSHLARRVQPLRDGDAEGAGEKAQPLGAEPGMKAPGLARANAQEADRGAAAKGEAQEGLRADEPGGGGEEGRFARCVDSQQCGALRAEQRVDRARFQQLNPMQAEPT